MSKVMYINSLVCKIISDKLLYNRSLGALNHLSNLDLRPCLMRLKLSSLIPGVRIRLSYFSIIASRKCLVNFLQVYQKFD